MGDDFSSHLIEPPAQSLNFVGFPFFPKDRWSEQNVKVICQDSDSEIETVGFKCSARHVFHAKAFLQVFNPILTGVTALVIPGNNFFGRPRPITGDDPIAIASAFQLERKNILWFHYFTSLVQADDLVFWQKLCNKEPFILKEIFRRDFLVSQKLVFMLTRVYEMLSSFVTLTGIFF